MLMLNITQKRLIDDWLIDRSLPSSLPLMGNEEDVDCESKTLHNCCSTGGVPSGLFTKRCLIDFTGQKQLFSAVQTIYQRTGYTISQKNGKATYYIWRMAGIPPRG